MENPKLHLEKICTQCKRKEPLVERTWIDSGDLVFCSHGCSDAYKKN